MATVVTDLTPNQQLFSYSGKQAAQSVRARGEVRLHLSRAAIAATGAGDNQLVTVSTTLPKNFAYVLRCYAVVIETASNVTVNFGDRAMLQVVNSSTAAKRTIDFQTECLSHGTAVVSRDLNSNNVQGKKGYTPQQMYNGVILPVDNDVQLFWSIYNQTANDIQYHLTLAGHVLQYDIDQAFDLSLNTPIPVRM